MCTKLPHFPQNWSPCCFYPLPDHILFLNNAGKVASNKPGNLMSGKSVFPILTTPEERKDIKHLKVSLSLSIDLRLLLLLSFMELSS